MSTKDFNWLDNMIAGWRLRQVVGKIEDNDKVLDFGCGYQGYLLRKIANKIDYGVGIDSETKNRKDKNLEFINYKFEEKLPFDKGRFNKIIMLAVLEHIEPVKAELLLKEFKRVLSQDGVVILTTPTPLGKPVLEIMAGLGIVNKDEVADHKKYYSKKELIELANKAGLKLINYKLFLLGLNSEAVFKKLK